MGCKLNVQRLEERENPSHGAVVTLPPLPVTGHGPPSISIALPSAANANAVGTHGAVEITVST